MTTTLSKPRRLICCCCGAETIGRQWHNRDTGYGLCVDCIDFCASGDDTETMHGRYGERGIHYDILEAV